MCVCVRASAEDLLDCKAAAEGRFRGLTSGKVKEKLLLVVTLYLLETNKTTQDLLTGFSGRSDHL